MNNAATITFGSDPAIRHMAGPPLPIGKAELLPAPPLAHDDTASAAIVKLPEHSGATRAFVTVKDAGGNTLLEAIASDGETVKWIGEAAEVEITPGNDAGELAPVKAGSIPETVRSEKAVEPEPQPVEEAVIEERQP